jgi:hypothetical protein
MARPQGLRQPLEKNGLSADIPSEREGDRNRFFGPADSNELFDAPPLINRVEWLTSAVLDHRSHGTPRTWIGVGGVCDEDLDFAQASGDARRR